MFEQMMQLISKYSNFIEIQKDGTVKIFIPNDINNPSKENSTETILTQNEAMSLINLIAQPKQYAIADKTISENDPEFDLNKWISLAIKSIKNK